MDIAPETIKHLANLSYIDIKPEDMPRIKNSLEDMLAMMNVLKNITPKQLTINQLMLDELGKNLDNPSIEHLSPQNIFKNNTNHEHHFFKVPKIISK